MAIRTASAQIPLWALSTACLLTCLSPLPGQTGMVMHLVLDDPQALLSSHPEGLHRLGNAFASSTATIASGMGGRALPQVTAGPANEGSAGEKEVTFQTMSTPPLGHAAFFRATLSGGSTTRQAGVGILPDDSASLSSLVTREAGFVRVAGGVDFLFRASSTADYPKLSLTTKLGPLGIHAGIDPNDGRLVLRLGTSSRSLDTNGDGSGDRNLLEKRSEGSLENGGIYHGALVVHAAPDHALTISFFLSDGPGPLDPATALSASVEGVWVLDEPDKSGSGKVVVTLGRSESGTQTLDLAAVRVFRPAPAQFPGFDAAAK